MDAGVVGKIKLSSVQLAKKYMKRVAPELDVLTGPEKEPNREFLLLQGIRFAFRIHQFAGGFDAESMKTFEDLRSRVQTQNSEDNKAEMFYPVNTFIIEDDDIKSLCRIDNLHKIDDRKLLVSSTKAAFDHQQQNKKLKKENEIESMITKINRNRSNNNHDHSYKELLSFEMCSDEKLMKIGDDDDDESCVSSDLFELENLSSIGVSTFSEELPVYGTTSLKKLIS